MISKKILNNTLKGQHGAPRLKHKTHGKSAASITKYKMHKDESPDPKMKTYSKSMATRFVKHESPSKMYADKYYKMNSIEEGFGTDLAATAVASASASVVPTALTLGVGAAMSAGSIIANLYKKYKWDKNGCDNIVNPEDRNQCEARQIDKYVSQLRSQTRYCSSAKVPQECTQKIQAEIDEQLQKKNDMFARYR